MAIVTTKDNSRRVIRPSPYRDERELEDALATHHDLLLEDDEPALALVQRQIGLPEAGGLDLLLVDATGYPVAVEVKLQKNIQSRREVVAQVFDYVSDLATLTVDELDDLTRGALDAALRTFTGGDSEADAAQFEARWKTCGANLRGGKVRVIVAVDDAPEGLIRIVQYIREHSDLDVRLISVQKYADEDGSATYVPATLVHGREETISRSTPRPDFQVLAEVCDVYDGICRPGLPTRGSRKTGYRQIRVNGWPKDLHYEFQSYKGDGSIGVDLHIEDDPLKPLAKALSDLMPAVKKEFPKAWTRFDPKWSKGLGALRINFPKDTPTEEIAKAMKQFIEMTFPSVDAKLNSVGLTNRAS